MGGFVSRKGVCVQGPPITALAWGVKQIDWQASGVWFQTPWSLFSSVVFRELCSEADERPEVAAEEFRIFTFHNST